MLRFIGTILLTLLFAYNVSSQSVIGTHDVQQGAEPNEYTIKTTIKGLQDVDIARIKYFIDNSHSYKGSPNNSLFSDINESYIKFYVMAVPASGTLTIEFGLVLSGNGEFSFPVEFQLSKNEEKQTINLPQINILGEAVLANVEENPQPEPLEEISEPTPTAVEETVTIPAVVEEMPTVLEPEVVKQTEEATTLIEEMPEATAVVEEIVPVALVVEEIPEVVEVEEAPIISEPVVEEPKPASPVIEEVPTVIEEEIVKENIPEPTPTAVEEEPSLKRIPKLLPPSNEASTESVKYSVQLLSLSKFSQTRLNNYCRQHNILVGDVKKTQVGEWTKITYGVANTHQEASKIRQELKQNHGVTDAFIVLVK